MRWEAKGEVLTSRPAGGRTEPDYLESVGYTPDYLFIPYYLFIPWHGDSDYSSHSLRANPETRATPPPAPPAATSRRMRRCLAVSCNTPI